MKNRCGHIVPALNRTIATLFLAILVTLALAGCGGRDQTSPIPTGPIPVTTGVAPTSGPSSGGTVIVITGTGFTGATAVAFAPTGGGAEVAAAAFTIDSDTQITATTPATSFSALPTTTNVKVTTPGGTSAVAAAGQFTFHPAFAVNPPTGPPAGGTNVTITGSGFTGATAVRFGAVDAGSFTVVSDNEITATSPAGSLTVDVTVTTPQGTTVPTNPGSKFTYVQGANFFAFNSVPNTTLRGSEVNSNSTFAILPGDAGIIVKASGANTTQILPSPTAENLRAVTQNAGNVYILVGDNGTILTSNVVNSVSDPIVWTLRPAPTANDLFGVESDATSQVAVGEAGSIIRSTDPTAAWTLQTSGVTTDLFAVTFGAGQFVAVGAQGTVLTSPDGITWTTRASGTTQDLRGVNVYVANATTTIIAVGAGGTIITSTDGGATWTTQISGTTVNLNAVGNTSVKVIAVGDGGLALVSPTGIGWAPSNTNTTANLNAADSKPSLVFMGGAQGTVTGAN